MIPTIDAEDLARAAVLPGSDALAAIAHRFGPAVLDADGALDRRALGRIVFADADARRALEAIVHPEVYAAMDEWFAARTRERFPVAIADVPLLYETGHEADFDLVIVASCSPEMQVARVMARDGLSKHEAQSRVESQMPLADKARRADHVIDTSGTMEETDRQIAELRAEVFET
jgi:dephospho-CoA kinase